MNPISCNRSLPRKIKGGPISKTNIERWREQYYCFKYNFIRRNQSYKICTLRILTRQCIFAYVNNVCELEFQKYNNQMDIGFECNQKLATTDYFETATSFGEQSIYNSELQFCRAMQKMWGKTYNRWTIGSKNENW